MYDREMAVFKLVDCFPVKDNLINFFIVIGMIGVPPGMMYGAHMFPGGHVLTPMMQPRFR